MVFTHVEWLILTTILTTFYRRINIKAIDTIINIINQIIMFDKFMHKINFDHYSDIDASYNY